MKYLTSLFLLLINFFFIQLNAGECERTVEINSDPAGAKIYINDIEQGETPLEIVDLSCKKHKIMVELSGFITILGYLEIKQEDSDNFILYKLTPKPGKLMILTKPAKAMVYLNKKFMGRTPLLFNNLKQGDYELGLFKENFNEFTYLFEVRNDFKNKLNVDLFESFEAHKANNQKHLKKIYFFSGLFLASETVVALLWQQNIIKKKLFFFPLLLSGFGLLTPALIDYFKLTEYTSGEAEYKIEPLVEPQKK